MVNIKVIITKSGYSHGSGCNESMLDSHGNLYMRE